MRADGNAGTAVVVQHREVIGRARAAYEAVTGVAGTQVRVGVPWPDAYLIEGPAGATTLEHAAGVLAALDAGSPQARGRVVLLRGWWSVLVHGACADGTGFVVAVNDPDDVAAMTDGVAGECEACQKHAARALVTVADGRARLCTSCLTCGQDLIDDVRPTSRFFADAMRDAGLTDLVSPRVLHTLEAHLNLTWPESTGGTR